MNLAIEYLLRDKKIHKMLTLPTSLFLTNERGKVVLTLNKSYGGNGINVKQWRLWAATPKDRLPPYDEFVIDESQIFSSPHVTLKDHCIMAYHEQPFDTGQRQYSDRLQQEIEYNRYLESFYNSPLHKQKREKWLWNAFEDVYVPNDLKFYCDSPTRDEIQMEIVEFYSKHLWYIWLHWRKHLLDFQGTAAELVFRREYVPKEPAKKSGFPNFLSYDLD